MKFLPILLLATSVNAQVNHCAPVYTNGVRIGYYCWRSTTPVQAAVVAVSNGTYTFKPPLGPRYNLVINGTNVQKRATVEAPPHPSAVSFKSHSAKPLSSNGGTLTK